MNHEIVVYCFISVNLVIFLHMLANKIPFTNRIKSEIKNALVQLKYDRLDEVGTVKVREKFRSAFKGNLNLQPLWMQYESTLVVTSPVEQEPILSPRSSEEYLNLENLLERSLSSVSFSIWNAVPQILTSIGIIGTFASILTSLLTLKDSAINEAFIIKLVNSLALGFFSSLVGVFLAVVFTYYEKSVTKTMTRLLAELNHRITVSFPSLTFERLLVEQSHILGNLSADISTSISSGFTAMTGSLGPALADFMDDETKKIVKNGIASSFLEINSILTDIKDESRLLKDEMAELRNSKQAILDTIKTLTSEQNKIQAEINVQSVNLAENLKSFEKIIQPLAEVARQVQATNELSDKLVNSVSTVTEATKNIQLTVSNAESMNNESVARFTEHVKGLGSEYGTLVTSIESWVNQSNISLQNNLGEFDKNIGDVLRQVLTISNSLNTSVVNLERAAIKLAEVPSEKVS